MFADGSGRRRSAVYTGGTGSATWRALALSTGESGIAELAAEGTAERLKGEEVRLIDVPVKACRDRGIFASLPEGVATSAELVARLEAACATARLSGPTSGAPRPPT